MSRSDPLLLLADIVQVASERPDLDPILVQVLYRHLVTTRRRHPTIQQARDYIDDLTSRLDEETLWRSLGLAPPRNVSSPVPLLPRRDRQTEQGANVTAVSQTGGRSAGQDGAVPGPGRLGPVSADRGRRIQERIGIEQARSRGGSPAGGGLTRDSIIDAAIEHREPDGTWPTQTTVSLELGKDEGGRRIRQVQGPRGWAGILEDAESRLANR